MVKMIALANQPVSQVEEAVVEGFKCETLLP